MSAVSVTDFADHTELEISIVSEGKLGIEFRSTSAPYSVINVSSEAQKKYEVVPGDLLLSVKRLEDPEWTSADNLEWSALVGILKHRPAKALFRRPKLVHSGHHAEDLPEEIAIGHTEPPVTIRESSALSAPPFPSDTVRTTSSHLAPQIHGSSSPTNRAEVVPLTSVISSTSPVTASSPSPTSNVLDQSPDEFSVVLAAEGPVGLEFEDVGYPFRVGGVRKHSIAEEKGIRIGDCIVVVNGKSTREMDWDALRSELAGRPAILGVRRSKESSSDSSGPSVWDFASGLVRGGSTPDRVAELRKERDELRQVLANIGVDDLEKLQSAASQYEQTLGRLGAVTGDMEAMQSALAKQVSVLDEERLKNSKLVEVIEEIERSQSAVIERFENEVSERERIIQQLKEAAESRSVTEAAGRESEALRDQVAQLEAKLELVEKDNTRMRKENTELSVMVQKCLEKIQRDLSDKPHWVDRRVVCSAIATLVKDGREGTAGESSSSTTTASLEKLADVLGLTYEERDVIGLNAPAEPRRHVRGPSFGGDFVSFLEREVDFPDRSKK